MNDELAAFRAEVRTFIAGSLDPAVRRKVRAGADLEREDYLGWQRALAARGWLTPAWPADEGGTGWDVTRQYLFEEELAAADCPQVGLTLAVGPRLVGPILCRHGTARQKQRLLPDIREARLWWCQGYSEPGAGSDLAGLRTRAHRVAGGWRVEGAKTWTSYAHWADRMACLVRTDAQTTAQRGTSFMALDMRSAGVTVRPIAGANGRHFFNEVFLDGVFVPDEDVIGPVNAGWALAKDLLEHERLNAARVAATRKKLDWALSLLREMAGTGAPAAHDSAAPWRAARDGLLDRLALLQAEHRALQALVLRFVARAAQGEPIGPLASLLKLRGTALLQDVMDLITDVLALLRDAGCWDPQARLPTLHDADEAGLEQLARHHHAAHALYTRGFTVAAGTSEVQRNVIARQVLGLGHA